jgi:hypothetical protein
VDKITDDVSTSTGTSGSLLPTQKQHQYEPASIPIYPKNSGSCHNDSLPLNTTSTPEKTTSGQQIPTTSEHDIQETHVITSENLSSLKLPSIHSSPTQIQEESP